MVTTHFPPLKEPLNASPSFLPLFSLLFTSLSVTFFMIKQERKGEKSNGREREMKPSINRATPRLPPTQKPRSTLPKKKLSTQKKKGNLLRPPPLLRHAPPRPGGRSPGRRRLLGARGPGFAQGPQEPEVRRRGGHAAAEDVEEGRRPVRRRRGGAAVPGDGGQVQVAAAERPGEERRGVSGVFCRFVGRERTRVNRPRKKLTLSTRKYFCFSFPLFPFPPPGETGRLRRRVPPRPRVAVRLRRLQGGAREADEAVSLFFISDRQRE